MTQDKKATIIPIILIVGVGVVIASKISMYNIERKEKALHSFQKVEDK